eukprot:TRINITY_DN3876_c0_g1_i1.p1 TRINITY_DN3876_c0_g1~~TRINITY_DN3876_c0_g1_i1.p1  ORF type:complete len:165 (+),score=42.29 TRINITY_DN3876_c0_g1_i1:34-495(+)
MEMKKSGLISQSEFDEFVKEINDMQQELATTIIKCATTHAIEKRMLFVFKRKVMNQELYRDTYEKIKARGIQLMKDTNAKWQDRGVIVQFGQQYKWIQFDFDTDGSGSSSGYQGNGEQTSNNNGGDGKVALGFSVDPAAFASQLENAQNQAGS